ncbi:redox-regulated ATPase YchF [Candidatus Collierbacteria bacterium]|nr:redox-regulated ATPase YchF [Candidatus Collierbacteria bacterium]
MSLKVGIVGLPNVGKSTLFNALLKRQQALVANYPFATIEPNVGVVEVPDERLKVLAKIVNTNKIVYATVEFVDIAGLVKGAATGEGLGNKFLSHIREVDVIVQVLRDFADSEVVKEGSVDPKSDYEVVTSELILKDLESIDKLKNSKNVPLPSLPLRKGEERRGWLERLYDGLNAGKPAREILVTAEERELAADLFLLTMKKEIKVLNVSEDDERLRMDRHANTLAMTDGALFISAKIEAELASLSEEEAKAYLSELGITESGLDKLIRKAYETLDKISFLTAGELEARAWTIDRGMKAPEAAGVIHTDFTKKFIKAKVTTYDDFVKYLGWKGAGEAGKVRIEGREYVMADGDVVEFMIGG